MNKIELTTFIKAPIEICFDLARSVDLHKISFQQTKEDAVGGVTSGLIGPNQKVLWQATHLGIRQTLETKISKYTPPFFFTSEMVSGFFKNMIHDHFFYVMGEDTVMVDHFYYESPLGILGDAADILFLKGYFIRLLEKRNEILKLYAETEKWMEFIPVSMNELQSFAEK
ncbi:MAG: SRPBCC family protein [Cyclobacteriaceae bacterium]|nr:SRPBCC family protein [Cyclobacteriaceae bacterium]